MNDAVNLAARPRRKAFAPRGKYVRFPPDQARRQGQITHLAYEILGREAAMSFLNTHNVCLNATPLELATADGAGYAAVECELWLLAQSRAGRLQ